MNLQCPHCGGVNDKEAIVKIEEEKVDVEKPVRPPKPPKTPARKLATALLITLFIFFGLPIIAGVIIGVSSINDEHSRQEAAQEARDNAWRTNPETSDLVEPITNILDIFAKKDEDGLINSLYLPEGSVWDKNKLIELFHKDDVYSGMWGKSYTIKSISPGENSEDGSRKRFYVDLRMTGGDNEGSLTEISMIMGKYKGTWKLCPDSCFIYGNKYMLPTTGDFIIDDAVVSTDCIVEEDYVADAYVIYQIPAMLKTSHTVSYDTDFGNLKKKISWNENFQKDGKMMPLFDNENLTKKQEEAGKVIEKFCIHLVDVAYELEDISELYPYLASDYDKELLAEQVDCYKKVIVKDESYYADGRTSASLVRIFPASKEEMCVLFNFYAGDRYDTWRSHSAQGKIRMKIENEKIVIASFYDNGIFECDGSSHIYDLPW